MSLFSDLMNLVSIKDSPFGYKDIIHNGNKYRIFDNELTKYSDFLQPSALECRGHTFNISVDEPQLVSLPMGKFFNYKENPFTMNLDLSKVVKIQEKLDGSLISTVKNLDTDGFFLKSHKSITNEYTNTANALLYSYEYKSLLKIVQDLVRDNYTVNFELLMDIPKYSVVIKHSKAALKVLNARNILTGKYIDIENIVPEKFKRQCIELPKDIETWIKDVKSQQGIEGYVLEFHNTSPIKYVKLKTDWYVQLHHLRDNINTIENIITLCATKGADDVKSLYCEFPNYVDKINRMEVAVIDAMNNLNSQINDAFNEIENMTRKDAALYLKNNKPPVIFSHTMSRYIKQDFTKPIYEIIVKNYKDYIPDNIISEWVI